MKGVVAATVASLASVGVSDLCTSNHGFNCVGDDLGLVTGITAHTDCCAACEAKSGCTAWTWHYPTADCYLKSACTNRQSSSDDYHSSPSPSPTPPSPTPTPPSPTPTPAGSHVRVTKALGSRGYNKVRVSLINYGATHSERSMNVSISTPLGGVTWSYQSQFQQRWTGNSIKSAVVDVTPGVSQSFDLDGVTIQVKVPVEDAGTLGMIIGDPCIHADSKWCKYGNTFKVKDTLHRVLNGLSAHDSLDYWMLNGDLFYDQSGSISKEFMTGLSLTAQARLSAVTLGNHDYWIGSSPPGTTNDSFGNGHMQFYAQDSLAATANGDIPFDFSKTADSREIADVKNAFWYNKVGNIAFIGFSNAYTWTEMSSHFQEACTWVGGAKPAVLLLVGHWNGAGDGCPSGMDDASVYKLVKNLSGCNGLPVKYIEGHQHCNANYGDGVLLGSFGFEDQASCHGAFGIPIIDTRNNQLKLHYFEMAANEQRNENFDAIVSCLESNGLDACLHYATTWWDESLGGSRDELIVV